MKLKILLYGDIDLNFLDGSAIWLSSIVKTLSMNPYFQVNLLLKAPVKEKWKLNHIDEMKNVNIINPYEQFKNFSFENKYRLTLNDATKLIVDLDDEIQSDCIILRGYDLSYLMAESKCAYKTLPYITDLRKVECSQGENQFNKMHQNFASIFIQTEVGIQYITEKLQLKADKFRLMTPMIPSINNVISKMIKSIVYTGKFAKEWYIEELISISKKLYEIDPEIIINIAGDKCQGELVSRKEKLYSQLNEQPNINWVGAVSREEAMLLVESSGFGFAWRDETIDNDGSLELSTKVLEYAQLGKPIFLRRTKMYEKLFGKDYYLFVDSEKELIEKFFKVCENENLYETCVKKMHRATNDYTFIEANKRLLDVLKPFVKNKINLLIAGHDLKFFNDILGELKISNLFNIKIDQWQGHNKHDENTSKELLQWADVIFCEWGLGNAVWYSSNKNENQKLIVRLHAQEKFTNYPFEFNLKAIDKFIVVSPYMMEEFYALKKLPRNKITIIPNAVQGEKFDLPKLLDSSEIRFNIGICGILPKLKRLDRAIELLEELWKVDNRYTLNIKSKLPQDIPWLLKREEEKQYYENLFEKIKDKPYKNQIIFYPHGNDVNQWLQKIGFMLSTSDNESFHLAPIEGMASGCIPVIYNWPGAETVYPNKYIFSTINQMRDFILNYDENENTTFIKNFVKSNYDVKKVSNEIMKLISVGEFSDSFK